jgi:Uma2 family endonuclease
MIASDVEQLRRNPLLVPITVDQYHQMIAAGILEEGKPIELLDGFLVRKDRSHAGDDPMTVGHEYLWAVYRLGELNEQLKPHKCFIMTQQPITIPPDNEPEPDGAILKGASDDYRKRLPEAADILAVIEVADSSLQDDRTAKQRIYATAGISQYIIINLVGRTVEIYTAPDARLGRYGSLQSLKPGDSLRLPTGTEAELEVPVERLLP